MDEEGTHLQLDSITLRGVGSYFHGAALQIRPLTILCGTNGSGKSTWFNALDLLRRSLSKGMLPFRFDAYDGDCHDMQLTNARVSAAPKEFIPTDEKQDEQFGPFGTIGINGEAIATGVLFDAVTAGECPDHSAARLLWKGHYSKGATFRLRAAHSSEGMTEYHQESVELLFDDLYYIRMFRPIRIPGRSDLNDLPYELWCSRAFFEEPNAGGELVFITRFYHGGSKHDLSDLKSSDPVRADLVKACARLILKLYEHLLRGFFLVTAIRDRQDISHLEQSSLGDDVPELLEALAKPADQRPPHWFKPKTSEQLLQTIRNQLNRLLFDERVAERYVGPHGEASLALWLKFAKYAMSDPQYPEGYMLVSFLSFWLKALLQVSIDDAPELSVRGHPAGYLRTDTSPTPETPGLYRDADDVRRFEHPCLVKGQSQGPARLSSGFHQLFPIIMQAALLQRGEILAIENPEVHLHPSLQLSIAEFLLWQADGGKTIIVETHSDLIIRRLIRAVLNEDVKQAKLGLHFVSLRKDSAADEEHSHMESLRINEESGQIENWPLGFLDEDIKESRRLFEIMYGALPEPSAE
jgi:ABC-type lipoprotein export system ATPase subunit